MGAVMLRSSEAMLRRFSRAERWTHRLIALDVTLLIVTAAFLYIPDISALVGNRYFFKISHVILGFALPIPIIIAFFFLAQLQVVVSRVDEHVLEQVDFLLELAPQQLSHVGS